MNSLNDSMDYYIIIIHIIPHEEPVGTGVDRVEESANGPNSTRPIQEAGSVW